MENTENENAGLRLLKRGQKGLVHVLFSRLGIILVLLVVQFLILLSLFKWFAQFLPHYMGANVVFMLIMVLYLLNSRMNSTAKMT